MKCFFKKSQINKYLMKNPESDNWASFKITR